MHSIDDEKKVHDYNRKSMNLRADFFNAAAKRHPAFAVHFNAMADATRDIASLIGVPTDKQDQAIVARVAGKYKTSIMALWAGGPELQAELKQSQKVLQDEMDAFAKRHPELVPARDALQQKGNGP